MFYNHKQLHYFMKQQENNGKKTSKAFYIIFIGALVVNVMSVGILIITYIHIMTIFLIIALSA